MPPKTGRRLCRMMSPMTALGVAPRGHPDADFPSALRYQASDYAIDPDARAESPPNLLK